MKKIRPYFFILLLIFLLSSCGTREVDPTPNSSSSSEERPDVSEEESMEEANSQEESELGTTKDGGKRGKNRYSTVEIPISPISFDVKKDLTFTYEDIEIEGKLNRKFTITNHSPYDLENVKISHNFHGDSLDSYDYEKIEKKDKGLLKAGEQRSYYFYDPANTFDQKKFEEIFQAEIFESENTKEYIFIALYEGDRYLFDVKPRYDDIFIHKIVDWEEVAVPLDKIQLEQNDKEELILTNRGDYPIYSFTLIIADTDGNTHIYFSKEFENILPGQSFVLEKESTSAMTSSLDGDILKDTEELSSDTMRMNTLRMKISYSMLKDDQPYYLHVDKERDLVAFVAGKNIFHYTRTFSQRHEDNTERK